MVHPPAVFRTNSRFWASASASLSIPSWLSAPLAGKSTDRDAQDRAGGAEQSVHAILLIATL